ncbi:MAG: FHA domain-containing protein [Gammaproteobacteria bacterium]|nr:FHA domain-containing protein [Gammaproteobacteria bacterium]
MLARKAAKVQEIKQRAYIYVFFDGRKIAEYTISKERVTIGRTKDNDIMIRSRKVSRVHSQIVTVETDRVIEDCNSMNGTFLNGQLIKYHPLRSGDRIQIGEFDLKYVTKEEREED